MILYENWEDKVVWEFLSYKPMLTFYNQTYQSACLELTGTLWGEKYFHTIGWLMLTPEIIEKQERSKYRDILFSEWEEMKEKEKKELIRRVDNIEKHLRNLIFMAYTFRPSDFLQEGEKIRVETTEERNYGFSRYKFVTETNRLNRDAYVEICKKIVSPRCLASCGVISREEYNNTYCLIPWYF